MLTPLLGYMFKNKQLNTHQVLQSLQVEALGVGEVVDKSAGSCYDDVWFLGESERLRHHVHPTHDHSTLHSDTWPCKKNQLCQKL